MNYRLTSNKEVNHLINAKAKEGWKILTGRKVKIGHPKGGFITISLSPSCPHAYKNVLKDIQNLERLNGS